jgi:hypothetical protein
MTSAWISIFANQQERKIQKESINRKKEVEQVLTCSASACLGTFLSADEPLPDP